MAVINPGVTSVTATSPVTSSGGTAPNIALTTSGANSVVIRDANQNVFANSFNDNYINVAASATQITLTVASTRRYTITGSGGQVIRLPDATTLLAGAIFEFDNNQSSGAITVNNNSNTLVVSVPSGGVVRVNLLSNAIAAGSWDRHDLTPANVSWSTNTLDYAGSITSATWNGNTVQVNRGGTGVTTSTGSGSSVLNTSPTLTTPAITGGTIDNTVIGGTTPAAGTFTTLIGGGGSANYGQLTGGATTKAVQFQTLGSDTNVSLAVQTKGTGAIDLAAGSSGVNISNGGTVTAVTRIATGSGYTSFPTWTASAPTTAGGTTASGSVNNMFGTAATIAGGGTGYTVGNVITVVGGTPTTGGATFTVTAVTGGVITSVSALNFGPYTALPTNPVSVTGGSGSGATLNVTYAVSANGYTITTAGSGYVEQPTITVSGGGGSGATAYAVVGSGTVIKSLFGTTSNTSGFDLATPAGAQVRIADIGDGTRPLILHGGSAGSVSSVGVQSPTGTLQLSTTNSSISSYTGGRGATLQFNVAHTASAVNYVQVTGAATGSAPTISAQGSDATLNLNLASKGSGSNILFQINALNAFQVSGTGTVVNRLLARAAIAGAAPALEAVGTDTDIDLTLTPKGAGNVRFGTYTANMALTIQGYIEIKDSGGTLRKLAVIA
jgi:hypothetical protein